MLPDNIITRPCHCFILTGPLYNFQYIDRENQVYQNFVIHLLDEYYFQYC